MELRIGEQIKLTITDINDQGQGIAKYQGMIIFIPHVLVGDQVIAEIINVKKNIAVAKVLQMVQENITKQIPLCPYYAECGGCQISHMTYDEQLLFKQNKVQRVMKKFANLDINVVIQPSNDSFNYRNKVTLKVINNQLGYYQTKTHKLVAINKCLLLDNKINDLIKGLNQFILLYPDNKINEIIIKRTTLDELMLIIKSSDFNLHQELINFIHQNGLKINSLYINNYSLLGKSYINENILDKKMLISNDSFFQVNYQVAKQMFNQIKALIPPKSRILDLYSGTGIIAGIISDNAEIVTGIEIVKTAYLDAINMVKNNHLTNVNFILGDVNANLDNLKQLNLDVIIVDPPRGGLSAEAISHFNQLAVDQIIYIACDPITLARDIKLLNKYEVIFMKSFDMFPQTYHVETIVKMKKMI